MTSTRGKNSRIPLHLSRSALWKNEKTKDEAGREDKNNAKYGQEDLSCERKGTRHSPSEIDGSRFLEGRAETARATEQHNLCETKC